MKKLLTIILISILAISSDARAYDITEADLMKIINEFESTAGDKPKMKEYMDKYFSDDYKITVEVITYTPDNKKSEEKKVLSKSDFIKSVDNFPDFDKYDAKIDDIEINIADDKQSASVTYSQKEDISIVQGNKAIKILINSNCSSQETARSKPYPISKSGYCKSIMKFF